MAQAPGGANVVSPGDRGVVTPFGFSWSGSLAFHFVNTQQTFSEHLDKNQACTGPNPFHLCQGAALKEVNSAEEAKNTLMPRHCVPQQAGFGLDFASCGLAEVRASTGLT